MKTSLKSLRSVLFTVLGLVILTVSCTKDENALSEMPKTDDSNFQLVTPNQDDYPKIDFLVDWYGFSKDDIEVTESALLAEGDIAFSRLNFWEFYRPEKDTVSQSKRHYKWSNLVWAVTNVRIYIHSSINSAWKAAIVSAYKEYNNLNGRIYFTEVTSRTFRGINVSMSTLSNSNNIAVTYYPSIFGLPGNITINTYYSNSLTAAAKKKVMMHELGHSIGIRHTDGGEGTLINGVSDASKPDPASVMIGNLNMSYTGFSTADKQAFLILYPGQ